jgi:hypothetical protein
LEFFMSIDATEVAYHEAGHTIIAILSGFEVQEVSIGRNESEGRWNGQTKRPEGSYRLTTKFDMVNKSMTHEFGGLKKELSIDCAGFLSQAKHHASLVCGTAHISLNNDIGQLLTWMKDEKPESQTNLEVRFTSDNIGEDFFVSVHPRWFGGLDRGVFLRGVRELMPLLARLGGLGEQTSTGSTRFS